MIQEENIFIMEVKHMLKCVYCSKQYDLHKGLTLIMKDGTVNHFCSSKCRKNKFLKRRKVRWISKKVKEKKVSSEVSK